MVKHIWSVLCKDSIVNQADESLSLMNIFEGFKVQIKKDAPKALKIVIPAEYQIVTLLKKSDKHIEERAEIQVSLIDPKGLVINNPVKVSIDLKREKLFHRHILKSFGFRVTTSGEYNFIIELKQPSGNKFEVVSMIPVEVELKK